MSTDLNLKTWPERIYLQSENEFGTGTCAFKTQGEVTWCQDQISAHDVEYVRADVAAPAQPPEYVPEYRTLTDHNGKVTGVQWLNADKAPPAPAQPVAAIPEAGQSVPDEATIIAVARAFAERNAYACNVNAQDNWDIYGGDYIDDVKFIAQGLATMSADAQSKGGA